LSSPWKIILTLLRRVWRPDHLEADNITPASEEQDRSSMADFDHLVRPSRAARPMVEAKHRCLARDNEVGR
jgi:hypothetical protein